MNLLDEFSINELKTMDVKNLRWWNILPLPWEWSRGAKTTRYYSVAASTAADQRRVKIEWNYTMDSENRYIVTPTRYIYFYDVDGSSVILSGDISKPFNSKKMGELNRDVRIGRVTDLRENAKGVPGDPANGIPSGQQIVDMVYDWYGDLIIQYEDQGNIGFEQALKNETDPTRLAVLGAPIADFQGLSLMQLLSFQLVGSYVLP